MAGTFSFTRKVVVVTRATRGLGRITPLGFGRAGAKVVISDIDDAGGAETLRLLRQAGGGAIVNQSSVTSSLTGVPVNGLCAATKGAVIALTKTAALEAAKHYISVNAIAACAIDVPGDMISQWIGETGTSPEQIMVALPVGRMGRPEELVTAVMFLCSDNARFITGHTFPVDGGFLAQSCSFSTLNHYKRDEWKRH
jgi:NAD(P)-dependent dehydrogenase (short-subunit alcohol dehydrogenase family)